MSAVPLAESAFTLPTPRTSLVGREREIATACNLLLEEAVPLLTLTGPGGVGKTRLSLAVADAVASSFAGGVAFVDLSTTHDPDLVLPAVGQTLGLRDQPDQSPLDVVASTLRPKQFLLVLDNFEQVLPAAPDVADLLAACPALQILVTSRAPLRVTSEQALAVNPLALPASAATPPLAELAAVPAVALFVQRARAANHTFALTEGNAAAVADLCRGLDGLPLALELAAARTRHLSPQALQALLSDRLRLLTGGVRDAPARQQTIRAAIAWSYDLLTPAEQALFRRLSVFSGGFTLDAAEAVAGGQGDRTTQSSVLSPQSSVLALSPCPPVPLSPFDLLTSLVDHSLVLPVAVEDDQRYGMLETLRSYAFEQLDVTDETEDARAAHAAYFVEFAETALRRVREGGWLDRLERDHDNLRAALAWARETGDTETGLQLAGALGIPFWAERGHHTEGRAWLDGFLATATPPIDTAAASVRARALLAAGTLAWLQGDFARATTCHGEALIFSRTAGDRQAETSALNNLAIQAHYQGDVARARPLFEETLALARAIDDRKKIADALLNLGVMSLDAGEYERSRALHEEALALYRVTGTRDRMALALLNLGDDAARQGDYTRAATSLGEGITLAREVGSLPYLSEGLSLLGWVAQAQGDLVRAATYLTEALPLCLTAGDRMGLVRGFLRSADLALALNQPDRAARLLGASAALRDEIGAPPIPTDQEAMSRIAQTATASLGEHGYAVESGSGRALSMEGAVAEVQALNPQPATVAPLAPAATPLQLLPPPATDDQFDLSPREREVLQLLAQRQTDKEIAATLFISHRTVMSHVANILGKLGVTNRREAAAEAVRLGLA